MQNKISHTTRRSLTHIFLFRFMCRSLRSVFCRYSYANFASNAIESIWPDLYTVWTRIAPAHHSHSDTTWCGKKCTWIESQWCDDGQEKMSYLPRKMMAWELCIVFVHHPLVWSNACIGVIASCDGHHVGIIIIIIIIDIASRCEWDQHQACISFIDNITPSNHAKSIFCAPTNVSRLIYDLVRYPPSRSSQDLSTARRLIYILPYAIQQLSFYSFYANCWAWRVFTFTLHALV